jgi:hypothetical protein
VERAYRVTSSAPPARDCLAEQEPGACRGKDETGIADGRARCLAGIGMTKGNEAEEVH